MQTPPIYPEPAACRITDGSVTVQTGTPVDLDGFSGRALPDLQERMGRALRGACRREAGSAAEATAGVRAGIVARELTREDVSGVNRMFHTAYDPACPGAGAYFLRIGRDGVDVAARTAEGFHNAFETMGQLATRSGGEGTVRLRNCVVFDFPFKELRAVRIDAVRGEDVPVVDKLLRAMAGLKYNTLFVPRGNIEALTDAGRAGIERCCRDRFVRLLSDTDAPAGMIGGLDGPSILDWEHVSRKPGMPGAAVRHEGALRGEEMAGSGFLFNLVYSASVLWSRDYTNFSWEKVVDLALDHMPWFMRQLDGRRIPSACDHDADVYPVRLSSGTPGRCAERLDVRGSDGERIICRVGERADAIVFRHAIAVDPCGRTTAAGQRPVGRYTVRYAGGDTRTIGLVENVNIGRESVWCGRRYDPWKRAFDTDARLRALCCHTMPVKRMRDDGQPAIMYDLAWENPIPSETIDEISIAVADTDGATAVRVEGVRVVRAAVPETK